MADLSLTFDLLARDRASREFDRVGNASERAGKKAEHGFGGAVKRGVGLAAGALLGAGIVSTFTGLYEAAAESAKVGKLTAQVIKTTGAAAGVTAGQVGDLATALSNQTGIDDEAIQGAENLLLTFTNVKNAAGAGNDVFNQTSALALDMSVALGKDASGAAMQLGKALNDPIKGVSALSRSGVSFTAQQKEQIATLVKSGDTLAAQKIILGEVGKEFGGAAAAAATPMDRLKVAAGNLQEQVGTKLIPLFSTLAGAAQQTIGILFSGDFTGGGPFDEDSPVVDALFRIRDGAIDVGHWIRDDLVPAFQTAGRTVMDVVGFFREHQGAAITLGVIVGGVAAAVAAAWIAQGAVATANKIRSVAAWLSTATASTTSKTIQSRSTAQIVVGWALAGARAALGAARVVAGWVLMGVQSMLQAARMAAAWFIALGPIGWAIAAVIAIVAVVIANWGKVKAFTVKAWHAVVGAVVGAWHAVTGAVSSGISAAVSFVSGLPGKVLGALGNFGSLLYNKGRDLIQGLISGAGSLLRNIGRFFLNLVPSFIRGPFEKALGISSPSKVFAQYGKNVGQGLIGGVHGMRPAVAAELAGLADTRALDGLTAGGRRGLGYRPPRYDTTGIGAPAAAAGGARTVTISGVVGPAEVADLVRRDQARDEFLSGAGTP